MLFLDFFFGDSFSQSWKSCCYCFFIFIWFLCCRGICYSQLRRFVCGVKAWLLLLHALSDIWQQSSNQQAVNSLIFSSCVVCVWCCEPFYCPYLFFAKENCSHVLCWFVWQSLLRISSLPLALDFHTRAPSPSTYNLVAERRITSSRFSIHCPGSKLCDKEPKA